MQFNKTSTILTLGFATVLGLMALLVVIGLSVPLNADRRLETIVNYNNTKSELIWRMRYAARERIVNLQNMLLVKDPFDRDAAWTRFRELAGEFIAARERLVAVGLRPEEQALLNQEARVIRVLEPLQDHIVALIMAGNTREAHRLLLDKSFPGQNRLVKIIAKLRQLQGQAAKRSLQAARSDYRRALLLTVAVAAGIAVLCIAIAGFVIRRTRAAEHRLSEEKERAQVTLYSIGDGVITTDARGTIENMNTAAQQLTGWKECNADGHPIDQIFQLFREGSREALPNPVHQVLDTARVVTSDSDVLLARADRNDCAVEHTAAPIFDPWTHQVVGCVLVFRDVTEMRALANQLTYQACHDGLTGLLNRREFESRLSEALSEVRRHPDDQHWLCYIDLDQFKVINDTCGHLAGDELLKQIAASIREHVRDSDLVARMGGDEFALLFRHCGVPEARETVERIRRELHELRFAWEDKWFTTTASIGLVPVDADSGTVYDLMSGADTACYIAKDEGRNRVHVFEPDDDAVAQREGEMQWVHRINQALRENRLVLYYQTIRPLQREKAQMHFEVLVRMRDESGELIPPMAFIPAAERYNLMTKVDRWVIRNTLEAVTNTRLEKGVCDYAIAINISTQSLCDDDFLDFVLKQLDSAHVDPGHICFEITETSAIANLSRARQFIHAIKERGCKFALDDFGSGLSSFGYLKTLAVDFLKIDGGFVQNIVDDPMDLALVESINQIGHVLGIQTIAEYVNNPKALRLLQRIGVDYGQGMEIAPPLPLDDLLTTSGDSVADQAAG